MKVLLMFAGSMALYASVVSGAGPLIVPAHPPGWLPSIASLGRLVPFDSLSEPAGLLVLGTGCVLVANAARRKQS
jgi:hypothetical protein